MPRMKNEEFGSGDTTWLGSTHGITNARTSVLTVSDFTKSDHYPNGYVPSGLAVNAADESAIKPYTGGAGEELGFILFDRKVDSADKKVNVAVLRHGIVKLAKLPVKITKPTSGAAGFTFVGGDA